MENDVFGLVTLKQRHKSFEDKKTGCSYVDGKTTELCRQGEKEKVRRHHLLEMIAPPKECWMIHVRMIRLWSLPRFKDPKSIRSIEIVLIDEQLDFIVTMCRDNNCGLYHTTSNHFRLFFQARTIVLPCFCYAIPLYGIKLVPFRKIMGYSLQHPFLVDVVGVMIGVEGEKKYVKNGKLIDMLVIHIENDKHVFQCPYTSLNMFI
ncbi:hypothetical protein Ahy_A09g043384 [Arachis hypogaea]|uniref:DUF223 domain-containing protein n=1 Tax=Arachis hypogaea TaxID=3818 RepID=A0A445BI54_ARAHY|nr:hypothetical protein Ahy_A09g043384 [Arachis hypogaea]